MDLDTNLLLGFVVLVVVGASLLAYPYMEPINIGNGNGNGVTIPQFKEVPRFQSYEELKAAFDEADYGYRGGIMEDMAFGVPMAMTTGAQKSIGAESGSSDFSTTNIQVEGVDEADIVKTDGKYIYNFSDRKLVITDAYPIEGSEIVSETELEGMNPLEMFVLGDKLLVFGNSYFEYDEARKISGDGIAVEEMTLPGYYGGNNVKVRLYDISDRENPKLEKELDFEGNYLTSRMIGDNAYFVVNAWPNYRDCFEGEECIIPMMAEDGVEKRVAKATEIGYIAPMPTRSFVTLGSINLDSGEIEKETIAGDAQSVFASKDNIYLAATAWLPRETFIPEGTVIKDIERAIIGDVEETVVSKFGLVDGEIGYLGQGHVPGHVLNQFSMDEFEGNFRIATTIGWNGSNSLYVLEEEMETIGKLEDLAPGESIYSVRFMGPKAYMVTFKKVDPLFVIDVSDPTNPTVLGKLKIPGYSDYLHPIDEDHIIGVGKEAIESTYGDFAWYQGLKMAIFDVSDVENPIEMHKIVIGDRGTDSYALQDHKAFLYDKEKELLVLPILLAEIPQHIKDSPDIGRGGPAYGEYVFQGAFVFNVNLEDGFVERGRITHVTKEDELKRGYYFDNVYSVKRALYIGDVLYTLSNNMLKANDLGSLEELKEFVFGA